MFKNYKVFEFINTPWKVLEAVEKYFERGSDTLEAFIVDIEDYSNEFLESVDREALEHEKARMTLVHWLIENGAEPDETVILYID